MPLYSISQPIFHSSLTRQPNLVSSRPSANFCVSYSSMPRLLQSCPSRPVPFLNSLLSRNVTISTASLFLFSTQIFELFANQLLLSCAFNIKWLCGSNRLEWWNPHSVTLSRISFSFCRFVFFVVFACCFLRFQPSSLFFPSSVFTTMSCWWWGKRNE